MNRYTPRRKKKISGLRIIGAQKIIRIDARTEIMVDIDVPDEEARNRYLERTHQVVKGPHIPVQPDEEKQSETSIGTLEDIETVIEETIELSEEE